MEFTQLKYFCAVAHSGHVTKSAEKLHIAQPALSQSIHRLENELGVKLFELCGRKLVLTECGRYLYKRVKPVIQTISAIPQELSEIANLQKNTVQIDVTAASALLTAAVIEYKKKCDINFRLVQGQRSESDIVMYTEHHHNKTGKEYVFHENIMIAVPDDGRFKNKESLRLSEVSQEGFVCLIGKREFRLICDKFCAREGFIPRVVFESDLPSTVQNFVASGCGIGFWPEFSWGNFSSVDKAKLLRIDNEDCSRDIVIELSPGDDNEAAASFFEFLKEYMEGLRNGNGIKTLNSGCE